MGRTQGRRELEVLCLGVFTVDAYASTVASCPGPGEVRFLDNAELHPAGTAPNTAIDLARLGVSVGLVGKLGADAAGKIVLDKVTREGVDVSGVKLEELAHTAICFFLMMPDGKMGYMYFGGTNATLAIEDIYLDKVKSARIFHVGGTFLLPKLDGEPTAKLLCQAKEWGVITSLDPTPALPPNALAIMQPCFPYLDYFLPNLEQACVISNRDSAEEAAAFFLEKGVGTVAVKMGSEGGYFRSREEELRLPAYEVEARDATGAGDAFIAGFLTGVLKGWPLERAGRLANAMGAIVVQSIGSTSWSGGLEEVMAFMNSHPTRK